MPAEQAFGLAGRVARAFVSSKLTPLIAVATILLGLGAVALTPREEEPQIVVPLVDVMVAVSGASPREIERQVTTPLERRLWGIPGVEYLYSTSRPGAATITVRFKVNDPLQPSLSNVRQELDAHPELIPPGAARPLVRLLAIDDVPFLTLTLHGGAQPPGVLRAVGEEVARELAAVQDTAQVHVIGGARRQLRIEPDPDLLRSYGLPLAVLLPAIQAAQAQLPAGALVDEGRRITVEAKGFALDAADLRRVVIAERNGRPVYLEGVARVTDDPEPEPAVVLFGSKASPSLEQAVTIAVAKRPGANAIEVVGRVQKKVASLRGRLIPAVIEATVTRNYGETAGDKAGELIEHLIIATLSVVALFLLAMGWRSAAVVALAVPTTLALTLLLTYLLGYTLNRATLFSLIFSIGILVDDAIVVVENVHRHLHFPGRSKGFARTVLDAVDEVGNPTILATFAVIAAVLPMAFVRGLVGPYMRPIPIGASLAMIFSLAIAFVISPWAALKAFRSAAPGAPQPGPARSAAPGAPQPGPARESRLTRLYRRQMSLLLSSAPARRVFLALVLALLGAAVSLLPLGAVKVKMLPFDNKSELQVQLDLPAGAAREDALNLGQTIARRLLEEPEVRDVQVYSGAAAPFSFVGMVRHSFLRDSAEQADVQVNLVPKGERKLQSHAIATRLRPALEAIAHPASARMKIVEIPPGPPLLDAMVAEIYGPSGAARDATAKEVLGAFHSTAGIVDVDSTLNATAPRIWLRLDREKAFLYGVRPAEAVETLALAGAGQEAGALHVERANSRVPLVVQLAAPRRSRVEQLLALTVPGARGPVPLSELFSVEAGEEPAELFHKNLLPVSYVFGDLAKEIEAPVYALAALDAKLPRGLPTMGLSHPSDTESVSLKWDGEWHVTLEVFRDLGLAFAAVLVLIYMLVVGWFESFTVPLVILVPVPLSLVGILPAHALLGAFFTAPSLVGFIAGAGIIVRNSIILVDFIELKLREGMELALAVEEAGVVRFRPMLLTAAAVMVGSAVMLVDPIFQGLAISLMAGEVAATLLSRMAVPVLYWQLARRGRAAELQRAGVRAGEEPAELPPPFREVA
ncbi:MAG TPA: efflux RND transporter permease subunit [Myxococcales bacterium]|nr:efflux RND transporter permease subunit [Myxococcales bacterium]